MAGRYSAARICTTSSLSAHPLTDTEVVSVPWQLWVMLQHGFPLYFSPHRLWFPSYLEQGRPKPSISRAADVEKCQLQEARKSLHIKEAFAQFWRNGKCQGERWEDIFRRKFKYIYLLHTPQRLVYMLRRLVRIYPPPFLSLPLIWKHKQDPPNCYIKGPCMNHP